MNKTEIEDEIQKIENMIKVYKQNNIPINIYIFQFYLDYYA